MRLVGHTRRAACSPATIPGRIGRKIVLAGNPNVGKSVFFGYLTGTYAEVSNYPGTTVEVMTGRCGTDTVIDTPGVYGISSFSDEERVARDAILAADVVVDVVDAAHLERDLFLTLQLADMRVPMVVALNLVDEAEKEGIHIDADRLSQAIGVPVVPTVATRRIGLEELRRAIDHARPGVSDAAIAAELDAVVERVGCSPREAVLILEGDQAIAERHGTKPGDGRETMYVRRRRMADELADRVSRQTRTRERLAERLGRWTLDPRTGTAIAAVVLGGTYYLLGVVVAQRAVEFLEGTLMQTYFEPAMRSAVFRLVPQRSILGTVLAGEFGVLTTAITYLVGLLLPLAVAFYLALSLLEDSGYLPRLATLADTLLNAIGLNGRAVIPIILGFGCITMATLTTRMLGTQRERSIAASILNFTIPCSAQLGIIAILLGRVGPGHALVYFAVIGACLIAVGTALDRLLPGESSSLLMNLPPMRVPRLDNVLRKTASRAAAFMREAAPWFAWGSLAVSLMRATGVLDDLHLLFAPFVTGMLHLPREAANAFIMGMVRRDFGAAGFTRMDLTAPQTLVAMVTITLFVPCVASVMLLFKERGWREAVAIWLGTWVGAFLVGGLVARIVAA